MVVIAVDMGGSKIKAALVNSDLSVDYSLKTPTNSSKGKKVVLDSLTNSIDLLISKTKKRISAIGISMPGIILDGKVVYGGKTLYFLEGTFLQLILEKKFHIPVILANDADCFALAESTFGAGKNYKKVLSIIWGSGVGGGFVCKLKNSSFIVSGTEIGHVKIYDRLKNKRLFVEDCAGGLSVEKEYKKLTGKLVSVKDIYYSKDKTAKLLIKRMIASMAKAISTGIQTLNPDIVILGGGVSNLPIIKQLISEIKKEVLNIYSKKLIIRRFKIADYSGLYGAAILALGKKKNKINYNI